MKLKNILIKITAIVVVIVSVISCDNDFNSVGNEVIGDVNFENNKYLSDPISYSKVFSKVQTSGLPNNLLGIYDDPTYGVSTYDVLSQIQPGTFNPTFGINAVLDSVVFNLPYFSTLTSEIDDETGETESTYTLDSIYGGGEAMKLSIYRSNYFLRDLDPNITDPDSGFEDRQLYYSNDIAEFGLSSLTDTDEAFITGIASFTPSADGIILITPDEEDDDDDEEEASIVTPRLRISLISEDAAIALDDDDRISNQEVIDRFTSWFLDKEGSAELSNANNFRNYFRGIYIQAEPIIEGQGSLIAFNIANSNITLYYSFEKQDTADEDEDDDTTDFVSDTGELAFSFSNNIINSIENDFKTPILEAYGSQDEVNGEENLYLKGGEGSYAVLDLFNKYVETDANGDFIEDENGSPVFMDPQPTEPTENKTELDFLKSQEWLINNASIKFYINHNELVSGGAVEPERIFIFDVETGNVLIDYGDESPNTLDPVNSATNHLGRINRDSEDEDGQFYEIRLTRHIIDVLNQDAENVQLGVAVSQNVNTIGVASGCNINDIDCEEDEFIPFSSIISHEGTVLYGNNAAEDVRLQLEISYTGLKNK